MRVKGTGNTLTLSWAAIRGSFGVFCLQACEPAVPISIMLGAMMFLEIYRKFFAIVNAPLERGDLVSEK